jgi:hypothetical protein
MPSEAEREAGGEALPVPPQVRSIADLLEANPLDWTDAELGALVAHWRAKRQSFNALKAQEARGGPRTRTTKPKLDAELAALDIDLEL